MGRPNQRQPKRPDPLPERLSWPITDLVEEFSAAAALLAEANGFDNAAAVRRAAAHLRRLVEGDVREVMQMYNENVFVDDQEDA